VERVLNRKGSIPKYHIFEELLKSLNVFGVSAAHGIQVLDALNKESRTEKGSLIQRGLTGNSLLRTVKSVCCDALR
jgi:hypothetical protein